MMQWKEEVEILDAELERTAAWFAKMSDLWRELSNTEISSKRGYSEYAHQKADMHARRSAETRTKHQWAVNAELKTNSGTLFNSSLNHFFLTCFTFLRFVV